MRRVGLYVARTRELARNTCMQNEQKDEQHKLTTAKKQVRETKATYYIRWKHNLKNRCQNESPKHLRINLQNSLLEKSNFLTSSKINFLPLSNSIYAVQCFG